MKQLNPVDRNATLQRTGNAERRESVKIHIDSPEERSGNFDIYSGTLTEEEAVSEASRCLNCGCGDGCLICVDLCNSFAVSVENGKPVVNSDECVACGICAWQCPNKNIELIRTDN